MVTSSEPAEGSQKGASQGVLVFALLLNRNDEFYSCNCEGFKFKLDKSMWVETDSSFIVNLFNKGAGQISCRMIFQLMVVGSLDSKKDEYNYFIYLNR